MFTETPCKVSEPNSSFMRTPEVTYSCPLFPPKDLEILRNTKGKVFRLCNKFYLVETIKCEYINCYTLCILIINMTGKN